LKFYDLIDSEVMLKHQE